MKIVLNRCSGNFGISKDFYEYYDIPYNISNILQEENFRTDKRLIDYVEKFGWYKASGINAHLKVYEIPAGTKYYIEKRNGWENIVTENDIKWEVAVD